jgi:hypothetical protein
VLFPVSVSVTVMPDASVVDFSATETVSGDADVSRSGSVTARVAVSLRSYSDALSVATPFSAMSAASVDDVPLEPYGVGSAYVAVMVPPLAMASTVDEEPPVLNPNVDRKTPVLFPVSVSITTIPVASTLERTVAWTASADDDDPFRSGSVTVMVATSSRS